MVLPCGIDLPMSVTAKVFSNGRSQAIRLPKEFRVAGKEVQIRRVPEGILISERNPWDVSREACEELSDATIKAVIARKKLPAEKRHWKGIFE